MTTFYHHERKEFRREMRTFLILCLTIGGAVLSLKQTTTDPKDPNLGRNIICWMIKQNFTEVCKEILYVYENSSIKLLENAEIGYCNEYRWLNPRHPEFGNTTWARKCPTEPPFYVADAHVWYTVFVFKAVEGGMNRTHIIGGLRTLGYVPEPDD